MLVENTRASEYQFDQPPSSFPHKLDYQVVVGRDVNGKGFLYVPGCCHLASLSETECNELDLTPYTHFKQCDGRDYPSLRSYVSELFKNGEFQKRSHSFGVALIITQTCNLTCSYCLAKQGTFGVSVSEMSVSQVLKRIDGIIKARPEICFIKFFGGEPTLRMDIIEAVSFHVRETLGRKDILLALTTNGTLDARKHIDCWKKYNISLSVSIDGPKEIHDFERKNKAGHGSYDKVVKYVSVLKKNNFPFCAIGVFDQRHLENGYSYIDTIRFLNNFSPLTKVAFVEELGDAVVNDNAEKYGLHTAKEHIVEAVDEIFDSIFNGYGSRHSDEWVYDNNIFRFINDVIRNIAFPFKNFCTASNLFTVFPDGGIYPCYTLTNVAGMKYGESVDTADQINEKQAMFQSKNSWESISNDDYNVPWYRGIVGDICLSDMIGKKNGDYESSDFYKCFQEQATFRVLQNLAPICTDSAKLSKIHYAMNEHQKLTGSFLYGMEIPESLV